MMTLLTHVLSWPPCPTCAGLFAVAALAAWAFVSAFREGRTAP